MSSKEMVGDTKEKKPMTARKKKAVKKKAAPKSKKKAAKKKKASKKKSKLDSKGLVARLKRVRGDRSQRQFAIDLGVFQQNVNRYEAGQTPHVEFLIVLATQEKVSIDWLLLGKGSPPKAKR